MEIQNKITLEDDFTSELLEIIERTKDFQQQIKEAKERIDEINEIKAKVQIGADTKKAVKEISETKKQINEIKKNVSFAIAAKDMASESIRKIKLETKSLVSRPFTAIIKAKDEISGVLTGITDKLFSIKTLAAGIILGGTGKKLYDFTLGQGVQNEDYQASLRTVLNSKTKGDQALAWSYQTALKTPFRADDVVAGVSNLATSQLDYKKFLMPLGNLAAVKNRPLEQAIEFASTLKSGDMGEAVMRGRELGINKQMWEAQGMKFDKQGSLTNTPDEALNAVLKIIKANHWNGLMDAKANTAGGLMSNIADTGLSFGRSLAGINKGGGIVSGGPYDVFKKQLQAIQPLMDKLYTSNGFKKLTEDVKNLVAAGGNKFQVFLKGLSNPQTVKDYEDKFNQFIKDIKAGWEVAKEFGKAIGTIGTALKPVFSLIAEHPKIFTDLFLGIGAAKIGGSMFKGVFDSFKDIKSIIKEFPTLDNALKTMVKNGGGGLKGVLKLPFTGLKEGFGIIKDTAKWIPGLFSITGKNIVSTFKDGGNAVKNFGSLMKGIPKNVSTAFGTLKGTLKGVSIVKPLKDSFKEFKNLGVMKELPKTLNLAFSPLKSAFGTVGNLGKAFGRNVGGAFRTVGSLAAGAGKNILSFVKLIPSGFNSVIGTVRLWVGTLGSLLKSKLLSVIRTVASGIMGIIRPLFAFIAANPIVLIIGAIIGACVLLYEAWKHNWGGIRDKTKAVIDEIKKWWGELKEFFAHPIKGTINILKSIGDKITGKTGKNALGTTYWEGGPTWLNEFGPEIVDLPSGSRINSNRESLRMMQQPVNKKQAVQWGQDIPGSLAKGIKDNTTVVTNATTVMANEIKKLIHFSKPDKGPLADADTYGVDMVKNLGSGIQNNIRYATTPTNNMASSTKSVVTGLIQQCPTMGQQVVQEIGSGIQSNVGNLTGIVKELTNKVITAFRTGFGINSPSRVMYELSKFIPAGVIKGISSVDIQKFIKNWIGDISSMAGGMSGNVSGWLTAALGITGTPMSWLPGLLQLVRRESGGNPFAYNGISVGGEHATGLLQMLRSTFTENMFPGLGDIMNPIANAASAIRYIKKRYGSVMNIPNLFGGNYKGYAVGLTRVPHDNFPALLHEDEEIVTGSKARGNKNTGNIIIQKLADKIEVRSESDIDKIVDKLYKKLEKAAYNMA